MIEHDYGYGPRIDFSGNPDIPFMYRHNTYVPSKGLVPLWADVDGNIYMSYGTVSPEDHVEGEYVEGAYLLGKLDGGANVSGDQSLTYFLCYFYFYST